MAGYTRQSSAQIVSGEVISASPINAELNQVLAAFDESTGHSHDGTSAEGVTAFEFCKRDISRKHRRGCQVSIRTIIKIRY